MIEPDDNTLDNAGLAGQELASNLAQECVKAIDGLPGSTHKQRAAIARIAAGELSDYADETER